MKTPDYLEFAKDKRLQWIAVIAVLFIILLWTSSIRLSNWDLLTDQTTGEKIPLALDPFYFLRLSETILEEGSLPNVDTKRYPSTEGAFSKEILPHVVVWMYKGGNLFGEYTLREVNVFSPVGFYFVAMILFFMLSYLLTKSKALALIAAAFLGFVPSYLYRTMAGFSDHESLGMLAFFIAMITFFIGLKKIREDKNPKQAWIIAVLAGLTTAFSIASWGGNSKFLFMIFPLSFLISWAVETKHKTDFAKKGLIFYALWVITTPLLGMFFGYGAWEITRRFMLSTSGLIGLFVLGVIAVDFFFMKHKKLLGKKREKYRLAYSIESIIILGSIGLSFIGYNVFAILKDAWISIFHPWGTGRVGLTVAENAQPYLTDWINQTGSILFWMFFAGMIFIGFEISKGLRNTKRKVQFNFFWIILICGTLFSRISSGSIMNGTNFISQVVYILSILVPLAFFAYLYFKEEIGINTELAFITSWLFFTLISGRAAQRIFFGITPFVCFTAAYFLLQAYKYTQEKKDDLIKPVMTLLLIIGLLGAAYSLNTFNDQIKAQASVTGPSAHYQWQNAMNWIRQNTPEDAIFVHWWDYGYWVETLGQRAAITDGGHQVTHWDHLIGRYLLTTPNPQTAYSFMKTHKVTHLLIDPTDVGKYPAYSRIGSDEAGNDRYSAIPVMRVDTRQTVETANSTILVFSGGLFVDEDISYQINGRNIFLPAQHAAIGGVLWEITNDGSGAGSLQQPIGVFLYNNQRYDIPLRYGFIDGRIIDYGSGIDAVIRVVPSFEGSTINPVGSAIYLSPRVASGLFARIYLLDNVFGDYSDLKLVHTEHDIAVQSLKAQGAQFYGDLLFYNGLRGPIKIWEVSYPQGTLEIPEFLEISGGWAELDNLQFVEG